VQRGGAVVKARGRDGEPEVEHERDGGCVARLGRVHERGSLALRQTASHGRVGGLDGRGGGPVTAAARPGEPGGVRDVGLGA